MTGFDTRKCIKVWVIIIQIIVHFYILMQPSQIQFLSDLLADIPISQRCISFQGTSILLVLALQLHISQLHTLGEVLEGLHHVLVVCGFDLMVWLLQLIWEQTLVLVVVKCLVIVLALLRCSVVLCIGQSFVDEDVFTAKLHDLQVFIVISHIESLLAYIWIVDDQIFAEKRVMISIL